MTGPPAVDTTWQAIRAVWDLLTRRERRQVGVLLIVSLITTLFETVGVASILPFMVIVVEPEVLSRYPMLGRMAEAVGADTWREAVILAAAGTGGMVVAGNVARVGGNWLQWQFEARVRHRLAADLHRAFLFAPYAFHVKRDAPSLMRVLGHDVSGVTGNIIMPVLTGVTRMLLVLALLGLLAWQSPMVALSAFVTLGGAYYLVFRLTKHRLSQLGRQASHADYEMRLTSQEGLAGIKEVTVLERRTTTSARFTAAGRRVGDLSVSKRVTETIPRHVLETLTILCILLVTVILLGQEAAGAAAVIPTLTLYVFVGYRLMPNLQQLYGAAMSIRYGQTALRGLLSDWPLTTVPAMAAQNTPTTLTWTDRIVVRDVTFTYLGATRPSLDHISLDIRRGESIGLMGRTGAGKSTLVDVLLGLFEPDVGTIRIDGMPLTPGNLAAWRRQVGYVAQHIFLANASVSENIALGLPPEEIDQGAVREAATLAQIDEFISTLPAGYATAVGERGVRLSGGERQRLGIARALYRRPSVLIFDEATSALDGLTEEAVMDAIRRLSGDRTVVLVAHRLKTLDACDRLVLLEAGRVIAIGSPAELDASSEEFRRFRGRS